MYPPAGSAVVVLVLTAMILVEVGKPYGIPNAPYLILLTYSGEVAKRYPASCYELAAAAEAALEQGDVAGAAATAQEALRTEISPNTKAKMHRVLAECAEHKGGFAVAVHHYEAALSLNPKLGVKRRLERLRSRAAQQSGSPEAGQAPLP